MEQYVGGKEASKILGVHQRTLYIWEDSGKIDTIRTPGGKRLYNVKKFLELNKKDSKLDVDLDSIEGKLKICYVRVSSVSQKDDLERQKNMMVSKYPSYIIIEDIGSGLNLNKRGIKK